MFRNLTEKGIELNLFLGIVSLVWLLNRRIFNHRLYSGNIRNNIWLVEFSWISAISVGTFEVLFHTDTSLRVWLTTVALLVTLRLLFRRNEEWYTLRRDEDCDEKDDNRP